MADKDARHVKPFTARTRGEPARLRCASMPTTRPLLPTCAAVGRLLGSGGDSQTASQSTTHLLRKWNGQRADVRAHIHNRSAHWHVLQNGGCFQITPFSIQRQKYAEVPDCNHCTRDRRWLRAQAVAHVIGVEQLKAAAGERQSQISAKRLLEHWQTLAFVHLHPRAG